MNARNHLLEITTFTAAIFLAMHAHAGSNNSIELELIGDNLKPVISQDGSNNKAVMKIKNTIDEITIDQKGDRNDAKLDLNRSGRTSSSGKERTIKYPVTLTQVGNDNSASMVDSSTYGVGDSAVAYGNPTTIQQIGNSNKITATATPSIGWQEKFFGETLFSQTGDSNTMDIRYSPNTFTTMIPTASGRVYVQEGNGNYAQSQVDFEQLGNNNYLAYNPRYPEAPASVKPTQIGNNNFMNTTGSPSLVTQKGDNNSVDMQFGAGRWGYTSLVQEGDGNSASGKLINSFYVGGAHITQKGDNNSISGNFSGDDRYTVSVEQEGDGNKVNASARAVQIQQLGDLNELNGSITSRYPYRKLDKAVLQDGTLNMATINGYFDGRMYSDGVAESQLVQKGVGNKATMTNKKDATDTYAFETSNVVVTQDGKKNEAEQVVEGRSNTVMIAQTGDANMAIQNVLGANNELAIIQNGTGNYARQVFAGDSNKSTITQTGTNHHADINITGSNNTYNVTQEGTGQSFSLTRIGNGATLNITQK